MRVLSSHVCAFNRVPVLGFQTQGWSISTESLQHRAQTMITFVLLAAAYWLLLLWAAGRDRASTLYVYDSFPGMCIIMLNLGAGAMFLYFLYKTRESEQNDDKRHFYFMLGAFCIIICMHIRPYLSRTRSRPMLETR